MSDSEKRMHVLRYKVKFLTPAFLGNAEQAGQWRTPPFKALLRQWWRVAVAREHDYDFSKVRQSEGRLFGHAWLEDDQDRNGAAVSARASKVRIRLSRWEDGRETSTTWGQKEKAPKDKIEHPEVKPLIGPLLYLGYGPLETKRVVVVGKPSYPTLLKANAAIQAKEAAELAIAVPGDHLDEVRLAFSMMNAYGALGGRSRNGWGSAAFIPNSAPASEMRSAALLRRWTDALELTWPHAIGRDNRGPMVWQTKAEFADWEAVMRELARLKIGLRTQFKFTAGPPHHRPLERHWLSYPTTNHSVINWRNLRIPNSLRFKVREYEGEQGKLRGVVVHMPCLPPREFRPTDHEGTIQNVWKQVHRFLDSAKSLQRVSE